MNEEYKCIIIGGGIAGLTAAIHLKRANINVLVIEKNQIGGQLNKIAQIENYPGFTKVNGIDLSNEVYKQAKELNISFDTSEVLNIEISGPDKIIKTTNDKTYKVKKVIIATGRTPSQLGLENETELIGYGLSYCALCDGPLFKNRNVILAGSSEKALQEAIYLSTLCKNVIIIHDKNELTAPLTQVESLVKYPNIRILLNTKIDELIMDEGIIVGARLNDNRAITIDGLFIYVGFTPNTKFLEELPLEMKDGSIVTNEECRTNIKGIYAIGDVIDKSVHLITTATGEGSLAAYYIKRDLDL